MLFFKYSYYFLAVVDKNAWSYNKFTLFVDAEATMGIIYILLGSFTTHDVIKNQKDLYGSISSSMQSQGAPNLTAIRIK